MKRRFLPIRLIRVIRGCFSQGQNCQGDGGEQKTEHWEPLEILEWAALLWILALAKARSVAPRSSAISAKRATKANAKINATVDGARQRGDWLRRSVVTARCGDAPLSLLASRPSASTRGLSQYFNRLLGSSKGHSHPAKKYIGPVFMFGQMSGNRISL